MKKKIGSFVIVLAVLALLFPCVGTGMTAYAEDGDFTIEDGVLTKYNGTAEEVVIPEGVTSISGLAFGRNTTMTSVTIPKSMTSFGDNPFRMCSELKSYIVESGNPSYSSQDGVLYNQDKTVLLKCPYKKSGIVNIAETVVSVKHNAFSGCTDMTDVKIPKALTSIESGAFATCTNLTAIEAAPDNPAFSSDDGVLFNKDKTEIVVCPPTKSEVTIPDSVATIGSYSFAYCRQIESIVIPNSVTIIGYAAFQGCSNLTNVKMSESLTTLEGYAFSYCTALKEILIPPSVKSIGLWSFSHCPDFTRINYPGSRKQWDKLVKNGYIDYVRYSEVQANIHVFYNYWSDSYGITKHPTNVTAKVNTPVSFTVKAMGEGLTYQWYYKKDGQTAWNKWGNRTTPTTKATSNATWHKMLICCRVTDKDGYVLESDPATYFLEQSIKITQQPESMDFRWGEAITLSFKAEGIGLTYQWYYQKQGQNSFSKWNGRTHPTETVTPNDTWDGIWLYCRMEDNIGNKAVTDWIRIDFIRAINITRQPTNVTVKNGERTTFDIAAEGEGLTYQWYYRKSNSATWSKWNGHTTASTSAVSNPTWNRMAVRCIVGNGTGETVTSAEAWVTLSDATKILQQPTDQTIALGDTIQLTVRTLSDNFLYQWYFKKAGQTSFSKWNGRTHATETVTPNATWDGIQLYCEIKENGGRCVRSDTVTITFK